MKMACRFVSLLLAVCMVLSAVPMGTLATEAPVCEVCLQEVCTCIPATPSVCETCQQENCVCATEPVCGGFEGCTEGNHSSDCALYVPVCDRSEDCAALTHKEGCPKTCLGAEICIDGVHTADCPLYEEAVPTQQDVPSILLHYYTSNDHYNEVPLGASMILAHDGEINMYIGLSDGTPIEAGDLTISDSSILGLVTITGDLVGYNFKIVPVGVGTATISYGDVVLLNIRADAAPVYDEPFLFNRMDLGNGQVFCDTSDPYHVVSDGGMVYTLCFGTPDSYQELQFDDVYLDDAGKAIAELGSNPFSQPMVNFRGVGDFHLCYDHDGTTYTFLIRVRHPSDKLLLDIDGQTVFDFITQPGTYYLSNLRHIRWGGDMDTEDIYTDLTLEDVTVSGNGVAVEDENGFYKITIQQGGSGALHYTYTIGGAARECIFPIMDVAAQPLTMCRWGEGQIYMNPGDVISASVDSGTYLYIGFGENSPVPLSSLSAEPVGSLTFGPNQGPGPGSVRVQTKITGEAKLFYTNEAGEKQHLLTFMVKPYFGGMGNPFFPGMLVCRDSYGTLMDWLNMPMNTPTELTFCVVQQDNTLKEISPDDLYTTADGLRIQRVSTSSNAVSVSVDHYANGYVRCMEAMTPVNIAEYSASSNSDATKDEHANLIVCDTDGSNPRSYLELGPGESKTVQLRYGSLGGSIPVTELFGDSSDKNVVTVTPGEEEGTFVLTATDKENRLGSSAVISHMDAEGPYGLTVKVLEVKAEDKMLFHTFNYMYGTNITPYMDLPDNITRYGIQFYFGDSQSSVEITDVADLIVTGPITIEKNQYGDGFNVTGWKDETQEHAWGTIGYEKDGIIYTMSVQISENGSIGGEGNLEARNTVILGENIFGTARIENEMITVEPNFGAYYTPGNSQMSFSTQVVLAAMNGSGDINTAAYGNISDVSIKLLNCVDEYDEVTPNTNASVSLCNPQIPSTDIQTWGAYVQAQAEQGFKSQLLISFTLKDTTDKHNTVYRRVTLTAFVSYVSKEGDVEIWATDLDTAGKLNVVLSSYEAFLNYLEDCTNNGALVNGRFALGGTIKLHLPQKNYDDGIVVAQMISDILDNGKTPISQIMLSGNSEGGTTMVGMVHKGGLNIVEFISFEADSDYTMNYGNNHFTCGILTDGTYQSTNDMAWDETYAAKYCPETLDTPAETLAHSTDKLNMYYPDLRWASEELWDINCARFIGFDYGIRTTDHGLAGGGFYGIFKDCFYGLYVDSANFGVSTGNPHHTDYNAFHFENNVFAIRLVNLPKDSNPYDFRAHDSDFIHNLREFWISPAGDYYFYRNYYGGYWQDHGRTHWKSFTEWNEKDIMDDWDKDKITGNRPGRYHDDGTNGKARVITSAGKKVSGNGNNSSKSDGYWIYDREDQNNRILVGEDLPLAQESIEALGKDTTVTVVGKDSNGNTKDTAQITFKGKGNNNGNGGNQ